MSHVYKSAKQALGYYTATRARWGKLRARGMEPRGARGYTDPLGPLVVGSILRGKMGLSDAEIEAGMRWSTSSDASEHPPPVWLGEFTRLAREGELLPRTTRPVSVARTLHEDGGVSCRVVGGDDGAALLNAPGTALLTETACRRAIGWSSQQWRQAVQAGDLPRPRKVLGRAMYQAGQVRSALGLEEGGSG